MLHISAVSMPPKPRMNANEREWDWRHDPCVGMLSVPLPMSVYPMAHVIEALDAQSFEARVQHGIVLVDFSEPWCGPCHMQLPILERVAERVGHRATVALLNVDETPALARHFNIEAIPTLLLFKDGQLIRTFVGVHSEAALTGAILAAAENPVIHPSSSP
jgi:thioredoxin 1